MTDCIYLVNKARDATSGPSFTLMAFSSRIAAERWALKHINLLYAGERVEQWRHEPPGVGLTNVFRIYNRHGEAYAFLRIIGMELHGSALEALADCAGD